MADSLEVSRDIAASPAAVWQLVTDLARMGELSPENDGGTWVGGTGAALGAKFNGTNSHGSKHWTTTATITAFEPEREFAFEVAAKGIKVARWGYTIEPTDAGCRVTEHWIDRRNPLFARVAQLATGVKDRKARNQAGMEVTLANLAKAVEAN
jgi:uncharacterized protein YndB with AHSA1/START domain